ncbi:MAG: hypothetical protein HYY16_00020 [Planctomycetes bacterium]|nr:hypothetical protein [Planctomycetota bacterium]
MKTFAAVVSVLGVGAFFAGCGSVEVYPETDVVEPGGFRLVTAGGFEPAGEGRLQRGTIEYEGQGDLVQTFREWMAAMSDLGWNRATENVVQDKATATLRRDSRTCTVEFASVQGKLKALIKVAPIQ